MARLTEHGLRRSVGVPGLFATAYGNVGSSIYYALGLVAAYALGLTPVVFVLTGFTEPNGFQGHVRSGRVMRSRRRSTPSHPGPSEPSRVAARSEAPRSGPRDRFRDRRRHRHWLGGGVYVTRRKEVGI